MQAVCGALVGEHETEEEEGWGGVIIDDLTKLEAQQVAAIRKTQRQIKEIETARLLPVFRKKYEGKYFKFRNSNGLNNTWPIYVYCRRVTGIKFQVAFMDTFQTSPKECKFEQNVQEEEYLLHTQITKREWSCALRAFKKRVERLGKKP